MRPFVTHDPLMQALVHVIRAPSSTLDVPGLEELLREYGVSDGDIETNANALTLERFFLYRQLVYGRFFGALEASIPLTIARIGTDLVTRELREFISQRATKSRYMRDITPEFLAFVEDRWRERGLVSDGLIELARHELLTIEIAAAPDDETKSSIDEVNLETRFRFRQSTKLVHYAYAVHVLPEDEADRTMPERRDSWVLGYRDDDHRVRFLELTPLAAAVVERLMQGECLRDAATNGCQGIGVELNDEALATTAVLLDDFEQRGVLVGTIDK
jgi:hypothetical protein